VTFDAQNCAGTASACVAGRPDQNDVLTFTYSKPMKASSVIPGWDGTSARNVRVNLTDSGSADTVTEVQLDTGTGTVSLGTIQLGANYVNSGSIAFLSSPIAQSADKTTFTITLGTLCTTNVTPTFCGGGSPQKVNTAKTVTWDPTATPPATDLSNIPVDPLVKPFRDFIAF
jgi:hypothetical protein